MIHLPKNGTRVKVWPEAKRKVALMAPRADVAMIPDMPADGATVVWDGFRYAQYLSGDIHLFDPETGKGEPYEFEHPHHEHNLELAAKNWKGVHGDRARKRLAEIADERATKAPAPEPVKVVAGFEEAEKTPIEMVDGKGELTSPGMPGAPAAAPLDSASSK